MARGSTTGNRALVRGAESALDNFKYEVARNIGINVPDDDYWGDIPARQCGAVGGQMVRKMIEMAEQNLAGRTGTTRR
jgi:small acid-soluble spore protein A (major alpha-type SASP)